jgi:hypothetical protein
MEMLGVMHVIPPELGINVRRYTVEIPYKILKYQAGMYSFLPKATLYFKG